MSAVIYTHSVYIFDLISYLSSLNRILSETQRLEALVLSLESRVFLSVKPISEDSALADWFYILGSIARYFASSSSVGI